MLSKKILDASDGSQQEVALEAGRGGRQAREAVRSSGARIDSMKNYDFRV